MKRNFHRHLVFIILFAAGTGNVLAQEMPTSQPNLLTIFIEDVKPGMDSDHAANEAGWPAAFAKAGSPYYYLAMVSMTGPSQVWYVSPYESYTQEGENMKMLDSNPELAAETERLWKADAQYLNSARQVQAMARPDLSYGAFPELSLARFWDITTFRVRPGHDSGFEAAVAAYIESTKRNAPDASWRTYQVTAGMWGSTYLIFGSVDSYAEFDKAMEEGNAIWQGTNAQEQETLMNFFTSDIQNMITNRFRLDPRMSYVAPDTKAADPDFWNPNR
jgi:hypothetical protein